MDAKGVPICHLTKAEIERWSADLRISKATLYDQVAHYVASGFNDHELPFWFCDAIVNDIHGIITLADEIRPDLFWRVFLAFDAGEYYRREDGKQDPVVKYTRPLIEQIIREEGLFRDRELG